MDGERILSRKTLELIRRNHIAPAQRLDQFGFPSIAGYGYGLRVRTMMDTALAGLNGSPGANENLPKRFAQIVYGAIDD
ncbi:MAG: hypothetical protein LBF95_09600 [Treponema sp.]|nr:hypothetical protein [Treponema sp.]